MDQPKIERLLRVMQLLINNKQYTVNDLARKLGTSYRTVYRYIDSFREAGFLVSEERGIYSLDKSSKELRKLSDLVYFSEEEAYIFKKAIESIDAANPVMEALKNKLYSVYNFKRMAEITVKKEQLGVVNALSDAIGEGKCVVLERYRSSNSATVSDRYVEPYAFSLNMIDVVCYEPSAGMNKIFKISRIEGVKICDNEWEFEHEHREMNADVFRMMSFERLGLKMYLTMKAANLLTEEFPLSESKLKKLSDDRYLFEDTVCSYEGAGRFVLGLCNEIEIVDSPGFIEFLENKRRESKF
jgi:predicted DNA-binding transcriptional regulator YafY